MRAQLQLDSYIVDELSYRLNLPFRAKPETGSVPVVGVDFDVVAHKDDKSRFLIWMTIDVNKKGDHFRRNRYQVHMRLMGRFRFEGELDEATKNRMIFNNGSSILYGVARGIVGQLTGTLGTERYILPAVNFLAIAEQKTRRESARRARRHSARR